MQISSSGDLAKLLVLLEHAAQRGEVQRHGRVLVALLVQCAITSDPQLDFARAAGMLQQHSVSIADKRWWPMPGGLPVEPLAAYPETGLMSPLVFAGVHGNAGALQGFVAAMPTLEQRAAFVNTHDGGGFLPLVVSASTKSMPCCEVCINAGADLIGMDGTRHANWALRAAADNGLEGEDVGCLLLK
jgi:hypothetical protein